MLNNLYKAVNNTLFPNKIPVTGNNTRLPNQKPPRIAIKTKLDNTQIWPMSNEMFNIIKTKLTGINIIRNKNKYIRKLGIYLTDTDTNTNSNKQIHYTSLTADKNNLFNEFINNTQSVENSVLTTWPDTLPQHIDFIIGLESESKPFIPRLEFNTVTDALNYIFRNISELKPLKINATDESQKPMSPPLINTLRDTLNTQVNKYIEKLRSSNQFNENDNLYKAFRVLGNYIEDGNAIYLYIEGNDIPISYTKLIGKKRIIDEMSYNGLPIYTTDISNKPPLTTEIVISN
jgi:hypothetical protein